jgi:chromate transport protein ChrA
VTGDGTRLREVHDVMLQLHDLMALAGSTQVSGRQKLTQFIDQSAENRREWLDDRDFATFCVISVITL